MSLPATSSCLVDGSGPPGSILYWYRILTALGRGPVKAARSRLDRAAGRWPCGPRAARGGTVPPGYASVDVPLAHIAQPREVMAATPLRVPDRAVAALRRRGRGNRAPCRFPPPHQVLTGHPAGPRWLPGLLAEVARATRDGLLGVRLPWATRPPEALG